MNWTSLLVCTKLIWKEKNLFAAKTASRRLLNLEEAFYSRAGDNRRNNSWKKAFFDYFFTEPFQCVYTDTLELTRAFYLSYSWRKSILSWEIRCTWWSVLLGIDFALPMRTFLGQFSSLLVLFKGTGVT